MLVTEPALESSSHHRQPPAKPHGIHCRAPSRKEHEQEMKNPSCAPAHARQPLGEVRREAAHCVAREPPRVVGSLRQRSSRVASASVASRADITAIATISEQAPGQHLVIIDVYGIA